MTRFLQAMKDAASSEIAQGRRKQSVILRFPNGKTYIV